MKSSKTKISLVLLSVVAAFLATELVMRHWLGARLSLPDDGISLAYIHDEDLGWFPSENSEKSITASTTITVAHNSRGFRDQEHIISNKPRLVFLGDSFVWGFDVEEEERFTEKLRLKLPEWSIYNLGVSGYGTDQELMLLKEHYDYYQPDIVFLLFCTENDDHDNTHNRVYNGFYKPYFTIDQRNLQLRGTPVPKSENFYLAKHDLLTRSYWFRLAVKAYFALNSPPTIEVNNPTPALILEIHELVKARGAKLIVGSTAPHPDLENFLSTMDIDYVDLSHSLRYPGYGFHWTAAGHALISDKILDFLVQEGHLKAPDSNSFVQQ